MNWYRVKIDGRYNGKPRTIQAKLRAQDERDAAYGAVEQEFFPAELLWHAEAHGWIYFKWETAATSFKTNHSLFTEMAEEITDAAELARLNGDPTLPLVME